MAIDKLEQLKESREQKRYRDRINREVNEKIQVQKDRFLDFFLEVQDKEGVEVTDKINSIDAAWRVYCKNKKLAPIAYPILRDYMTGIVDEYKAEKEKSDVKVQIEPIG